MEKFAFLMLFCLFFLACKNKPENKQTERFDKVKWATVSGRQYPYRNKMIKDLIENVPLKKLKKEEVIDLLGQPSRTDNGYLFYTVAQEFLGNTYWPLYTKTLVIKLRADSTVEWRKIHE
jgi:hypothetical protein